MCLNFSFLNLVTRLILKANAFIRIAISFVDESVFTGNLIIGRIQFNYSLIVRNIERVLLVKITIFEISYIDRPLKGKGACCFLDNKRSINSASIWNFNVNSSGSFSVKASHSFKIGASSLNLYINASR